MKEKSAFQMVRMIRREEYPKNRVEEKLLDALTAVLLKEYDSATDISKIRLPRFAGAKWEGYRERFIPCRLDGLKRGWAYSPYGIDELNHSCFFLWECSEFILALWGVDLLMEVLETAGVSEESISKTYNEMKLYGFQEILGRTKSPVRQFFDDPWVWRDFEEETVTDNVFYLYSVLTGTDLPDQVDKLVTQAADAAYLNSFLLRFIEVLGESVEDERAYDQGEWMVIGNETLRRAVMLFCSAYGVMDGSSYHQFIISDQLGKLSDQTVTAGLPLKKRKALEYLARAGNEWAEDITPRGLSARWPSRVEGILPSGRYLLIASGDSEDGLVLDEYIDLSCLLFHALARQWIK